ncbi:hypothetical protein, partial [Bacteroides congonensis]|uniref:hypothetical protein n=1 Tax=Bacteroides congonensis TaxID=1871006 RepID=UPI002649A7B9
EYALEYTGGLTIVLYELKQIGDKRRRRKGKTGKSYLFSNKIVFSCRDKPGCGVFIYVTPIIEEQN